MQAQEQKALFDNEMLYLPKEEAETDVDFDELEAKLDADFQQYESELEFLKEEHDKIGNPESLGTTIGNVVWEQFINQIGVTAGEEFIKENRGLNLDLSKDAHIQTTDNFASGKIATHNTEIDYQERYDTWQGQFQKDDQGNVKYRYSRITGKDEAVLNKGARDYIDYGRPNGSSQVHMDHTVPAAEIIRDPEANAHLSREEHYDFANGDINLKPLDAIANESKGDNPMVPWLESERNGQKPAERFNINEAECRENDKKAREEYSRVKAEGEARSIETGKQSRKAEAMRAGKAGVRAVFMALLANLFRKIVQKLVAWLKSAERKISTFIDSVKQAIKEFVTDFKRNIITSVDVAITSIATAIFGPVVGLIKKAWIFLKQGWKSLKEAIDYIRNPQNRKKSFSILMMEVGKIIIVGAAAGGAIVLGEVIEKALMTIPFFAFPIPLLGSLANILGIFFGAVIAGIIGALALNLIDRLIAKKQKQLNIQQQNEKLNEMLTTQRKIIAVNEAQLSKTQTNTMEHIQRKHGEAADMMRSSVGSINDNDAKLAENDSAIDAIKSQNDEAINNILGDLDSI